MSKKLSVKEKQEHNLWEDPSDFKEVLNVIDDMQVNDWYWFRNMKCKYIDLRIDMRSGHFILCNRDGERIDIEDLKRQNGSK